MASVVSDLGVSDRTIYTCRKQELIDTGHEPGSSLAGRTRMRAARRRIRELEAGTAVTRRANKLLHPDPFTKGLTSSSGRKKDESS